MEWLKKNWALVLIAIAALGALALWVYGKMLMGSLLATAAAGGSIIVRRADRRLEEAEADLTSVRNQQEAEAFQQKLEDKRIADAAAQAAAGSKVDWDENETAPSPRKKP